MTTLAYVILGIIIGGLLLLVLLFRAAWRVAEPDEALIVSGFRTSQRPDGVGESMGFRIVTGRGCLVAPGITQGPAPFARGARERDRCAVRLPAEDPRRSARCDRLQGRRRLPFDRQRRAAFP